MASSNLQRLGLANQRPVAEKVAILVGPNGSGKSRFLRELAIQIRGDRDLAIISNTAHDRFSGLRGLKRITAGRGSRSPKSIVKRAIGRTIDQPDSRFYQIGAILDVLSITHGVGAGNVVAHGGPKFQIESVDLGAEDNVRVLNIKGRLLPNAGNDDLTMICT